MSFNNFKIKQFKDENHYFKTSTCCSFINMNKNRNMVYVTYLTSKDDKK